MCRACACRAPDESRRHVRSVLLASGTLPFAERLNAGVVAGALTLSDDVDALDLGGSQRAALSAVAQAVARVQAGGSDVLVLAADARKALAASAQELEYGDAAAALLIGKDKVLAEFLGAGTLSVDYHWEERWVGDEGISKLVPRAVAEALQQARVVAGEVDHFIFPSSFAKMDAQVAKACGFRAEAVVDPLLDQIGDSGLPHALLMLAQLLERAEPGKVIVLAQFGSGAQALVFRTTDAVGSFRPARGVSEWNARGVEERSYTKFLAFKGQLQL